MSSIETVKRELKPWMSSYGEVRYYIEDWYPLVSDVLDKYAAEEWMSPDPKKIKRAKVWFDTSARIHVDGLKDEMVVEIIRSNIEDRHFLRLPERAKSSDRIRSYGMHMKEYGMEANGLTTEIAIEHADETHAQHTNNLDGILRDYLDNPVPLNPADYRHQAYYGTVHTDVVSSDRFARFVFKGGMLLKVEPNPIAWY